MMQVRSFLAVLLTMLLVAPAGMGQQTAPPAGTPANPNPNQAGAQAGIPQPPNVTGARPGGINQTGQAGVGWDRPQVPVAPGEGWLSNITRPYRKATIAPLNLANSSRLESLLRAGQLYLSLQDAIALALENNLDIELSRLSPITAQTDLLRAQAGGLLRGVPTAVRQGPASAQSQAGVQGGGGGGGAGIDTGATGGAVITQTGVATPNLDPVAFFGASYGHNSRPQANTITTGRSAVVFDSKAWQFGLQQSFTSGTTVSYGWNNSFVTSNNPFNDLNPNTSGNMNLQITQRLLQGFGFAVNNRNIRVAKNDVRISDLVFTSQVMTTVSAVINLYWDLVSFNEDVKVRRKALEVAEKFYSDNKKQVEIGTLAPIEIVRAEAQVARAQQDLTNAETQLLQQETIIKNALSRTGVASPAVAEARVIPTDQLRIPVNEPIEPIQDLTARALQNRPDVRQTEINIENLKIGIAGTRSALLPSLDLQASFQNNALSGSVNNLLAPDGSLPLRRADPFFVGGYGSILSQIFRRNFPDYSIGFQLNIPLRNRTAQADYIRDQLTLRQQEIGQQRQINDIRVSVHNAVTALQQARARYQAALKERQLQEQTLDAEQRKYALGASTAFQVIQTQRDLAQAQAAEVQSLSSYSRARVQLDLATADILQKYDIQIEEAKKGTVSRAPSPLPVMNGR